MPTVGAAGSTTISTLSGLARFLTDTLEDTSAYSDANIVANLNYAQREVQAFLLSQIMNEWKENTLNGTGTGLKNLTAGTNSYIFPTDMLSIDRVEINYSGGANTWVKTIMVKLGTIDEAISNTSGNAPIRGSTSSPLVWVRDGYIYIDPIPSNSVTSGLKIWCTTLVTDLALDSGETTYTPVFVKSFHQVLAVIAAIEWLRVKEQYNRVSTLERRKMELLTAMLDFYSKRVSEVRTRFTVKSRNLM